MFLIPLNQPESVALVIHALRVAGGEADCGTCPVQRVCMKQCLTIAASLDDMYQSGSLPTAGTPPAQEQSAEPPQKPPETGPGHLKVIK
jgi:hypothetical protein